MMDDLFDSIAHLTEVFGPSGQERMTARYISSLAKPYADEVTTDTLGNLIVHRRGNGEKLMLSAHMDTTGLVVTYIEEDGTLRVGKLGNVDPRDVRNTPVCFTDLCGQTFHGVVRVHGKANEEKLTTDDLYIDMGVSSREEAQKLIQLGDVAVFDTPVVRAGNRIQGPHLDNRVACAVLLKALEMLQSVKELPYDLYCVFTVQGKLGLRGAKTAAFAIDPDYAISIDATAASDWPGAPKTGNAVLGGGVGIKLMDASTVYNPKLVKKLAEFANLRQIKFQRDVQSKGSAEAGTILQNRHGVVSGGVSLPCRGLHTPVEMMDLSDISTCAELVAIFAANQ